MPCLVFQLCESLLDLLLCELAVLLLLTTLLIDDLNVLCTDSSVNIIFLLLFVFSALFLHYE